MFTDSNGFSELFMILVSESCDGSLSRSSFLRVFLEPEFFNSFKVSILIGSPKTSFDALRTSPRLSNVFSYSDWISEPDFYSDLTSDLAGDLFILLILLGVDLIEVLELFLIRFRSSSFSAYCSACCPFTPA